MSNHLKRELEFKKLHEGGIHGLIFLYGGYQAIIRSSIFWISLIISASLTAMFYLSKSDSGAQLTYIKRIAEIGVSVDGGLIGLSLAGLTLVVTFGSGNFMKTLVRLSILDSIEKQEFQKSIYQSTTAKFAFAVMVQVVTLFWLIVILLISDLEIEVDVFYSNIINNIVISLSLFLLIYALLLVIQMTINIFTIGQHNHMIYFDEISKEEVEKDNID